MKQKTSYRYVFFVFAISSVYLVLIGTLFWFFDPTKFVQIFTSDRTFYSLKLSIGIATVVALISTLLAIPAAYALSRYKFPGKQFLDNLLELPMIVSPAALGAMILLFFSTKYGSALQDHTTQIVFAIGGIFIAQLITVVGVSVRLIKSVMDEIPVRYEHISRTLGATQWQSFRTVTLPLAKKGILASYIVAWAKAVGEFGATIMVAGAMPLKTETLTTSIFLRLASADIDGAVIFIILLLSIGFLALSLFRFIAKKSTR